MNLKQEALRKLQCVSCNLCLSVGPITTNENNDFLCGRCYEGGPINHAYEVLAAEFIFPCRYKPFGCTYTLKWGQVKEHEDNCSKKPCKCPKSECAWLGSVSTIAAHFRENHCEDVIESDTVEIKLDQDQVFSKMLSIRNGNYLFSLSLKKQEDLKLSVVQLISSSDFTQQEYRFKIASHDTNNKHLTLGPFNMEPYRFLDGDSEIEVKTSVLEYLSDAHASICCQVVMDKEDIKAYKEELMKVLECPICKECMGIPIHMCLTGHSFCEQCVKNLPNGRQCPLCRTFFSNARNYALEDLAHKFCKSCKNKGRGCGYMCWPEDINEHEQSCVPVVDSRPACWRYNNCNYYPY